MGMMSLIEALVFIFAFIIVLYAVMVFWQPFTATALYPLLNNAEAFPYGSVTVLLLNLMPFAAVAAGFIAFFNHAMKRDRETGFERF